MWSATSRASELLGQTVERDALILTALPLEYAAVRERLLTTGERRAPSGARYVEGQIIGHHITWTVRVFETGMGNSSAAAALARAARDFPPDLVVFSGIAGGLRGDEQRHGDVVAINTVYNGAAGKSYVDESGGSSFKGRPAAVQAPEKLVQIARSLVRSPEPLPSSFDVSVIDLVSTESVQADPANEFAQRRRSSLDNARAVDMETFGLYEAARVLDIPAISIRGLSDLDGIKSSAADADWQPVAAGNAAAVALELLIRTHPSDVARRGSSPGPSHGSDSGGGSSPVRPLPPYAERWIATLEQNNPAAAESALSDLSSSTSPPKTTVSVLVSHPPAWVRQDRTGSGWAALAAFADAVGSLAARTAWARAAEVTAANADPAAAVLFGINRARSVFDGEDVGSGPSIKMTQADLAAIDTSAAPALEPVVAAWRRLSEVEDERVESLRIEEDVLTAAREALIALRSGGLLPRLALPPVGTGASHADSEASLVELHATVTLLLAVGIYLLVHQDGRARFWTEAALSLAPWSTSARLRSLQVQLQAAHDSLRTGAADTVTDTLVRLEAEALELRTQQRAFGGNTAEALALAGRARIEMGDPHGALRLLCPAPRGLSSPAEAADAQVAQLAAVAALRLDDVELAAALTAKVRPEIDRHFLTAATFSQSTSSRHRAIDAYRAALALASNRSELERALSGLARMGVDVTAEPTAKDQLARLRAVDQEAADLVLAWHALVSGDGQRSLHLARKYQSLAGVMLQADALTTLGRASEAVDVLDNYGTRTGDVTVRIRALELAGRASDWPRATQLAEAIIATAATGPVRDAARRARSDIAARTGDWREVEHQLMRVVRERAEYDPESPRAPEASPYAWQLAEAQFHQRKFDKALAMLKLELRTSTTDTGKVRLGLALLHQLRTEHVELIDDTAVGWVLTVASSMIDQADIGGSAVTLLIALPRALSDAQHVAASKVFDEYFATWGDEGAIRKIDLPTTSDDPDDVDLQPLFTELRTSLQPSAKVRSDTAEMVDAGRLPLAVLALIAHRSYAQALITRMLGRYIARPRLAPNAPLLVPAWLGHAQVAIASGSVVIDTSALVLAHKITDRRDLLAAFNKVLIPRTLQKDIYAARTSLALRSSAFMGWNEVTNRPVLIEHDPAEVESWATAAVELEEILARLSPVDDAHLRTEDPNAVVRDLGDVALAITAEATARQLGVALWTDDAALARLAEAENVPVFGTPELIAVLRERGPAAMPSDLQVLDALRRERVVDLPEIHNWSMEARADRWSEQSYLLLAITRPNAWVNVPASFARYQNVIRDLWSSDLEDDARVTAVLRWCHSACLGLSRAVAGSAQMTVVSTVIAWTVLNTEPTLDAGLVSAAVLAGPQALDELGVAETATFEHLLSLSEAFGREKFPDGNLVRSVVGVLSNTLDSATDGATAAAVLARSISTLTPALRDEAFAAFWRAPKSTR
jgi:nucleoside phosphorylase